MEMIRLQGRMLSDADLKTVRAWIAEPPRCHRTALSVRLCPLWNWRNEAGRLKDLAARTAVAQMARPWPPQVAAAADPHAPAERSGAALCSARTARPPRAGRWAAGRVAAGAF